MTNVKRLSKLDIVITFIRNIRQMIPLIIIGWLQIKNASGTKLLIITIAAALLLTLISVGSFLAWRKFQFSLNEDRLIIRKGIFNREEKTIYYNRIHSVNVQQPLLLRIFGTASLQIETPGGSPGRPEGELRVLKHKYALQLQQQLKHLRSISTNATGTSHTSEQQPLSDPLHDRPLHTSLAENGQIHADQQQTAEAYNSSDSQYGKRMQSTGAYSELEYVDEMQSDQIRTDQMRTEQVQSDQMRTDQLQTEQMQSDQMQFDYAESPTVSTILADEKLYTKYNSINDSYDYKYHLSFAQLLKASLTSFNINFALIFIFGIYSFADDVLDIFYPGMYDKIIDGFIDQYSALPIFLLLLLTVLGAGFVWLLSILIYLIKFGDYQISRSQEQIAVSYGLLEKKSFIFDKSKVQAVIMNENPLRQWLGFAELRVQVITSNAMEQLVIHPFVRKKDIPMIIAQLLPDRIIKLDQQLHAPPRSAYRTYALVPTIILLLITVGAVWWLKWGGFWLLLLLPMSWVWSLVCMRTAGVLLEDNQLILRSRSVSVTTYFIQRKHIVTLSIKTSPVQRKRLFSNIHVQVLGSPFPYRVKSIANEHLLPIWNWFSRR